MRVPYWKPGGRPLSDMSFLTQGLTSTREMRRGTFHCPKRGITPHVLSPDIYFVMFSFRCFVFPAHYYVRQGFPKRSLLWKGQEGLQHFNLLLLK